MPEFEVTIKIKCGVTARDEETLAADLSVKEKNKDDLARLVQSWLNGLLKEEE